MSKEGSEAPTRSRSWATPFLRVSTLWQFLEDRLFEGERSRTLDDYHTLTKTLCTNVLPGFGEANGKETNSRLQSVAVHRRQTVQRLISPSDSPASEPRPIAIAD